MFLHIVETLCCHLQIVQFLNPVYMQTEFGSLVILKLFLNLAGH